VVDEDAHGLNSGELGLLRGRILLGAKDAGVAHDSADRSGRTGLYRRGGLLARRVFSDRTQGGV